MEIIVTVGPSSLDEYILQKLKNAGASSFRINLSHSTKDSLERYFKEMQKAGICPAIDTQGAQLRVIILPNDNEFSKKEVVIICFGEQAFVNIRKTYIDRTKIIVLNHPEAADQVEAGDLIKVDFGGLSIELKEKIQKQKAWMGEVKTSGKAIENRAVDIHGKTIKLSALTEFDKYAIKRSEIIGCKEVYASFIHRTKDIDLVRKYAKDSMKIIAKIESAEGVGNAESITNSADAILIDRGDLSREISIPAIPIAVSSIIRIAKSKNKKVYVATNILDSMMKADLPSRAEISDIYTLLDAGVDGLVLAAEVAIGNNPVESTALLEYLIRLYSNHKQGLHGISYVKKPDKEMIGDQLYNWI